jgi:hypothetical protein
MKILWAVRIGDEVWQEQVITEHESRIPAAMEWAKANGFDRFRIAVVDDSKPDFTKVLTRR